MFIVDFVASDPSFPTGGIRAVVQFVVRGASGQAHEQPEQFHAYVASNPGREADTRLFYGMDGEPPHGDGDGWLIVISGTRDYEYLRPTALQWQREVSARDGLPW